MGTLGGRSQLHVSGAGEKGGLWGSCILSPFGCVPPPLPLGIPSHIALPHSRPLAPVSPAGLRSLHHDTRLTRGQAGVRLCRGRPGPGAAASAQSLQTPPAADEEPRQPSAGSLCWPKEAGQRE